MNLAPEAIPHGQDVALLCLDDPAWLTPLRDFFAAQGYYVLEKPDSQEAIAALRMNPVAVAVASADQARAPLAAHIAAWPGLKRRQTCLTLVGGGRSLDSFAAFMLGADWVLAQEDHPQAARLMAEALSRFAAGREPWKQAGGLQPA